MDKTILNRAIQFAENHRGSIIDLDAKKIIIPFDKGISEDYIMVDGMMGKWFADNGFQVSFEIRDVEYTTKDTWMNYKGWTRSKGHKAYLRNRLVATLTW